MKIKLSSEEMAQACYQYLRAKLGPSQYDRRVDISFSTEGGELWAECYVTEKKPVESQESDKPGDSHGGTS